jgi:hypothetical protein
VRILKVFSVPPLSDRSKFHMQGHLHGTKLSICTRTGSRHQKSTSSAKSTVHPSRRTSLLSRCGWYRSPLVETTFSPRLLSQYSSPPTTKREALSRAMSGEAVGYRLNTVDVGFPRTVFERDPRLTPKSDGPALPPLQQISSSLGSSRFSPSIIDQQRRAPARG